MSRKKSASKESMPYGLRSKCFALRCRSKRGETLTKDELEFCLSMGKKYPKDYAAMDKEVFNATVPFGAPGYARLYMGGAKCRQ